MSRTSTHPGSFTSTASSRCQFGVPALLVACVTSLAGVAVARAEAGDFGAAEWIWSAPPAGLAALDQPAGAAWFRASMTVSEKAQIRAAELLITADNQYSVYLNGRFVGATGADPNAWNRARRFDVAPMLAAGHNVLAIEAVNTAPGPAGLLVRLGVALMDGQTAELTTHPAWKCATEEPPNWQQPGLNDQAWPAAISLGTFGAAPWGKFAVLAAKEPAGQREGGGEPTPPADYAWPEALVFVGDDCSLYRPVRGTGTSYDSLSVTVFNPRNSRAFPEHDLPSPMKVGRKLYALKPAKPGTVPQLLLDAGTGALGSPAVSFDGRWIYFSMAPAGEAFFHIYKIRAAGGTPQKLTDGPFHDIDPCELPDGNVVFTSTRIGTFEEYHNSPSRALFKMDANGRNLNPLTHTIVFDNEPEVLADGRILCIRSDNFFDRGKVETQLHAIHPDGTAGLTEFGLDMGPEYGGRLRAFNCGSPAPMADGRVAFLTESGIAVGSPGCTAAQLQHLPVAAGDVAALPDGRLLCTLPGRPANGPRIRQTAAGSPATSYSKLVIADPAQPDGKVVTLYDSPAAPLHSPVFLGARQRPPILPDTVDARNAASPHPSGVLVCQNARFTKNTTAGWPHVRAIRVLAGKGLTLRSSHSYIVHAGSEVSELGTVPLAPDGSFAVEVPADTPIAFQAVDAEGRSELNEMSWIYVRPGETRSCVGCHQPRQTAPPVPLKNVQALLVKPLILLGLGQPPRLRGNNPAVTGLMELQFDRYREVAGINRHSDSPDPLATGTQEVAAAIAKLQDPDANLRISAAQRLGIFRHRSAAPALALCLQDAQREVRVAAAIALAACGTRDSAPPLLDSLLDSDPLVAQAAALALENLTANPQPFDPFGDQAGQIRQAAAWRNWLQQNPWDMLENALVKRLSGDDRDDVRKAALALGHTGGSASCTGLRAYVLREHTRNPYPVWRKTHRGDNARFNSLEDVNPRTLQAAVRSLGWLSVGESPESPSATLPLLTTILDQNANPDTANLFLAEAAVQAIGHIGTPKAMAILIDAFSKLPDYPRYTNWYGDHEALMACHASPVHAYIIEALDANGSTSATSIVPDIIRSVPTDPDRALLPGNDDYETLAGRVIRRSGLAAAVTETCLAILGDPQATQQPDIAKAMASTHPSWAGTPDPLNRAAQILSLVCRDRAYAPRISQTLLRYWNQPVDIPRVFNTGIPVVTKLPTRHWVSFFLARSLGNLADARSVEILIELLDNSPPEAASGRPDPLGPGVLFLHNDLTPCWRAEVAWALGRIGEARAFPVLLKTIANLDNATDTRYAAAIAAGQLADAAGLAELRRLAQDYPEISVRRALLMR
jgi:HEAT repeat protein